MSFSLKSIWKVLRVLVTVSLIIWLFRLADRNLIWTSLARAKTQWLLLAIPYPIITMAIGAFRWRILLSAVSLDVVWIRLYRANLKGLLFNNFAPGDLGSDIYRTLNVSRGGQRDSVLTTVVYERMVGSSVLLLISLAALVTLRFHGFGQELIHSVWWFIGILLATLVTSGTIIFLARHQWEKSSTNALWNRILRYLRLFQSLLSLRVILVSVLLSVLVHSVVILAVLSLAKAYSVPTERLVLVALVVPVGLAISMLPISIGGHGVRETAFVFLLRKVGVQTEVALLVSMSLFGCIAIASLTGALLILMESWQRKAPKTSFI